MAITKNIIDLMNGEIYVDSSIGVGTTFTVVLHLKEADRNGLQEKEGEEENRGTSRNFEGKRILLVEDNELNREIAREFLTLAGVTIEEAQNGKEAVEMVEKSGENYYDLIFMDIQMPLMNGYEAAKAIRALHRRDADLPIIAMTANAFSDDIRMAKEAGMNEHISKPIDIKKLFKAMEEFRKFSKEKRHYRGRSLCGNAFLLNLCKMSDSICRNDCFAVFFQISENRAGCFFNGSIFRQHITDLAEFISSMSGLRQSQNKHTV